MAIHAEPGVEPYGMADDLAVEPKNIHGLVAALGHVRHRAGRCPDIGGFSVPQNERTVGGGTDFSNQAKNPPISSDQVKRPTDITTTTVSDTIWLISFCTRCLRGFPRWVTMFRNFI